MEEEEFDEFLEEIARRLNKLRETAEANKKKKSLPAWLHNLLLGNNKPSEN